MTPAPATGPVAPGPAAPGEPCDLVVVSESEADVELTLRSLEREGLAVRAAVARDGEAALERLLGAAAPAPPRLVLLDRRLPKLDGLDVLRRLKGDARTRAIPVVLFVSGTDAEEIRHAYQLGANSCVAKPVDFDRFRDVVGRLGAYWLRTNEAPPPRA